MDFIRNTSEKMNLWPVEHFFPPFFSRSVLIGWNYSIYTNFVMYFFVKINFPPISTDLEKNGGKVFNWSEVHFFGSTSYEIHILTVVPRITLPLPTKSKYPVNVERNDAKMSNLGSINITKVRIYVWTLFEFSWKFKQCLDVKNIRSIRL